MANKSRYCSHQVVRRRLTAMAAPIVPYHRLAYARGRWRAIGEVAVVITLWLIAGVVIYFCASAFTGARTIVGLDPLTELTATLLLLAALVPLTRVSARLLGRYAGTLSSIAGRLRWRWLLRCVVAALVLNVAMYGVLIALSVVSGEGATNTAETSSISVDVPYLVLALVVVPLQASGKEYFFRVVGADEINRS